MPKNGLFLTPVPNYLKNVSKSIAFSTADTLGNIAPNIKAFSETNGDFIKNSYGFLKNPPAQIRKGIDAFRESKVYEALDAGVKNTLEDLRTGNFYNKARDDQYAAEAGGFGDDDDFDFDFDMDDDSTESKLDTEEPTAGDKAIVKEIATSNAASTSATVTAIVSTNDRSVSQMRMSTSQLYQQNERLFGGVLNNLATTNATITALFNLTGEALKSIDTNSSKFYTESLKLDTERNAMLKEILEIQRNTYKSAAAKEEEAKKAGKEIYDYEKVASGGILDIGEYTKAIIKNVNDQLESAGAGMLKAFGDPAALIKTFFSTPLKGVSNAIANTLIAPTIKMAMGDLDDIMGSIAGQIFGRLDNAKSKDGLMGWMGKIFGLNSSIKDGYDASKYEKGAVPFDGITRKAIIDVIPGYLRKIESHLSGSEERIFDYNTGKWTNANAVKQSYYNIKKSVISRSSAVLNEDAGFKRMKKAAYDGTGNNAASKAKLDAFFEQLNDYLYENNGIFNPLESAARNGITSNSYPLLAKNYYLLQQIFAGTGRAAHLKLAGSIQSNKNNLRKQYEAQQNIIGNVYGNMFDGSAMNSHIKVTEKGKVVGATSNLLLSSRDEQYNNVFDYLRNQLVELKKHTELLSEQLLHGGGGYSGKRYRGENGKGPTGPAITKESIANKINGIGVGQLNSLSFRDPEEEKKNGQKITNLELIELLKSNPYIIAQELGEYIKDEEDENGDPILVQEARDRLTAIIKDREAFEKLDRVQRAAAINNGDLFDFAGIKAEDIDEYAKSLEILKDMNDARAKKMTYEEYVEKKREKEDKKNRGLDDDEEVKGPAGFKAFMKRLYAIRNKASDPIVKMADTLGTSIYDIFYQAPVKDEDGNLIEGGIIGSITNRLKNTFTTIKDNFSKNFIDPLRDKYDLDDFEDRYTGTLSKLAGGAYSYLVKDSIDDLFKRFKDSEGIDLSGNKKYAKKGQVASIAREYRSARNQEEYILKQKSEAEAIIRDPNQSKEAKKKAQEDIDHYNELLEFAKKDRRVSGYQSQMDAKLKDLHSMRDLIESEEKKDPKDRDKKKIKEMSEKALTAILKTRTPEEVREAAKKAWQIGEDIKWLKEELKNYEDALKKAQSELTPDLSKVDTESKKEEIADIQENIRNTATAINNKIKESETLYNLYLTFKALGYYTKTGRVVNKLTQKEEFQKAIVNADMGDYEGGSLYRKIDEGTKELDSIVDTVSKDALKTSKEKATTDEEKAKIQENIDVLETEAAKRQSKSDLTVQTISDREEYARKQKGLVKARKRLNKLNKKIADYRGDKNSDEYKKLVAERDKIEKLIRSLERSLGITIETSAKGKGRFAGITSLSAGETIYNARGKYKVPSTGIYRITEPSTIIPSGRGVRQDEAAERLKIKQAGGIPMHADGTEESSESSSEEESVVIKKDKKGLMKMIDGFLAPKSSDGEVMGEVKDKLRTKMPEILAHGTIGGVLGLLLGMPVLGAGLGAATGVITNSEKLQDMILGKKDSNGERAGGLISKKVQDAAKKWLPDMAKGGALGAIAGLVTPFGPVGGLMIGAGLGLLKNTKDFQTKFYGDDSSLKITDKQKESMLKIFKAAGIGAGAGLLSSLLLPTPFGIMGNAVMGTAIGLMSTNEEFKERLFGFKDNKGVRHGGLISDLADGTSELKKTFIDIADKLKSTVLDRILDPLARFVEPAIHEIPRLVAWLPLKILGVVDNWFGNPLRSIGRFVTGIANKALKLGGGILNGTLGAAAKIITEPLGKVGDRLKMNQINRNDASRFSGDARVKSQIDFIRKNYKTKSVDDAIAEFEEAETPDERLNAANKINSLVKPKDRINISDVAVTNIKSKNSVQSLKELGNAFLDIGSNSADVMKNRKRARNELAKKLRAWKSADNKPLNPRDIDRILEAVDAGKDDKAILNGIKNARIKGSKTAMTDEEFRNFTDEFGFNKSLASYRAKMTSLDKISNGATLNDLITEYDKALPGMGNYLKSLNLDLSKPEDRAQLTKMAKKFFDQADYLNIYGDHSDDELHTSGVKDSLNAFLDSITGKGEKTVFDEQNEVLTSILNELTAFKQEIVSDFTNELFGKGKRAKQIARGIKKGEIDLGNRRAYTSAKKDENGEFILDENGNKIYEFNRDGMIADVKSKFDKARFDGDKELFSGLSDEEAASIVDNLDLYDAQTAARKYAAVGVGKDFLRFNKKALKALGKGGAGLGIMTAKGAIGVGKFGIAATKFGAHVATAPVRGGAHLVENISREAALSNQVPKDFKNAINKYKFAEFVHPGMINRSNFQAYCNLFELGYVFDASGIRYINECMQKSKGTYKKLKSILMDKNIIKMLAKGKSDKKNFTLIREYLEYLMKNSSALKDKADILVRRKLSVPSANAFLYDDLTENPSLDSKNAMEAAANSEAESNDDASASVERVSNNGIVDGTTIESHASGTEGGDVDENKKSFFRVIGDTVIPFKKTAKGWAIDETNPVAKAYKNAKLLKEAAAEKLYSAQLKASHAVSSVFNVLKKPPKFIKWLKWLVVGGVLLKSGILGQIFEGIVKPIWSNTIYPWVKDTALPWIKEKVSWVVTDGIPLLGGIIADTISKAIGKLIHLIFDKKDKDGNTVAGKAADKAIGGDAAKTNNVGKHTVVDTATIQNSLLQQNPNGISNFYDENGNRLTNAEAASRIANMQPIVNMQGVMGVYNDDGTIDFADDTKAGTAAKKNFVTNVARVGRNSLIGANGITSLSLKAADKAGTFLGKHGGVLGKVANAAEKTITTPFKLFNGDIKLYGGKRYFSAESGKDITDNLTKFASKRGITAADKAAELGDKVVTKRSGAVGKAVDVVEDILKHLGGWINKLLNLGPVKNVIIKMKNILHFDTVKGWIDDFAKKLTNKTSDLLTKNASKISKVGSFVKGAAKFLAWATVAYDFISGMDQAESMLGVSDTSILEEFACGIAKALGNITVVIPLFIGNNAIARLVCELLGDDLTERQAEADAAVKAFNDQNGTTYSTEEYMANTKSITGNIGSKIKNAASKAYTTAKNTAGNLGDKIKSGVSAGWDKASTAVVNAKDSIVSKAANIKDTVSEMITNIDNADVTVFLRGLGSGIAHGDRDEIADVWKTYTGENETGDLTRLIGSLLPGIVASALAGLVGLSKGAAKLINEKLVTPIKQGFMNYGGFLSNMGAGISAGSYDQTNNAWTNYVNGDTGSTSGIRMATAFLPGLIGSVAAAIVGGVKKGANIIKDKIITPVKSSFSSYGGFLSSLGSGIISGSYEEANNAWSNYVNGDSGSTSGIRMATAFVPGLIGTLASVIVGGVKSGIETVKEHVINPVKSSFSSYGGFLSSLGSGIANSNYEEANNAWTSYVNGAEGGAKGIRMATAFLPGFVGTMAAAVAGGIKMIPDKISEWFSSHITDPYKNMNSDYDNLKRYADSNNYEAIFNYNPTATGIFGVLTALTKLLFGIPSYISAKSGSVINFFTHPIETITGWMHGGSGTVSNAGVSVNDGSYGMGKFAKQTDPSVAKMRFNTGKDSEYQTIGDSGCGPVAAVNAVSTFGRGKSDIVNAANMALNGGYKETNGGTDPNFFNEYFASKGLGSSGIVSDKNELYSNIANGNPTVLMGKDNNGASSKTPFGRTSHYVTALGTTNDGLVKVTDPEGGDMLYNPNDLLDKTTLGVSAFGRGKFNFKKLMGKDDPYAAAEEIRSKGSKYGKGPDDIASDFTRYKLTDSQLKQLANAMLNEQAGVEGVMSEASMAANLLETSRWSKYNGDIVKMMQNDGWFAKSTRNKAYSTSNPGDKYVNAVKSVLVDGNRVFPLNINEHDCFSDISHISNSGTRVDIRNRDNYKKNITHIKNNMDDSSSEYTYIFYDWAQPSEKKGDPFGYTMSLEQARAKKKKFGLPVGSGNYVDLRSSDTATDSGTTTESTNPEKPTNIIASSINALSSFLDSTLGTQTSQTTQTTTTSDSSSSGPVTRTGADGSADKLITTAVAEEGYKESGDNNTKYGAWNGINNAPWCASFVSWSANQAGIPTSVIPKTAAVATLLNFYSKKENGGVHRGDGAKPGDILIQKDSSHSHTGIVTGVDNNNVYTVEGNSSDKVARRAYKKSDSVNRYGTPNFAQPATVNLSNTASVGTAASFSDTRGGNKNKPASKYGSFLNNARYGKGNSISVRNISRNKSYNEDTEYNDVPENMRGGKGTGVYEAVRNFIDSKGRTTEDNSTSKLLKSIIAILTTIADNTEKLNAILDFLNDTLGVALSANDVTNLDQNSLKAKLRAAMSGDINSSLDTYNSTMSDTSMARIMNIMTSIASA